jgi:hypothetical protein
MRALIAAVAIAAVPGATLAQGVPTGPEIRHPMRTFTTPSGARKQAEGAILHELGDPADVKFREERAREVASVRRGAFQEPIAGPVSIVCGQYGLRDAAGGYAGYAWFFAAIKRGQVLWTISDKDPADPGDAYYSCKGAGLTEDHPQTMPDD